MSPIFLNLSEVLRIHRDQIERYGGDPGIRDPDLLKSAIAMPMSGFGGQFLHENPFEMAAAYLFHITKNHPVVGGNKRTGVVCALVFLELNGIDVNVDEDILVEIVISLAEGGVEKKPLRTFFEGALSNNQRKTLLPKSIFHREENEDEEDDFQGLHKIHFRGPPYLGLKTGYPF